VMFQKNNSSDMTAQIEDFVVLVTNTIWVIPEL